ESYLMQKLSRQVFGSNNIDNCSRYCQAPATKGLFRTVGHGGDSGSIDDLEKATMTVLIGTNTAEAHPVIASRIKRAQKLFGQRMHVFDIRKHEMAERADEFYQPKPGTDLVWLSAVTKYIIDHHLHDIEFIKEWVDNFDEYYESLTPFSLEYTEEVTGISKTRLISFAEECAKAESVAICWAMGVTQQDIGSDTSTAISNLLLVTDNYRRPGTGAYPLRGHNNVQGASDMGSMPDQFPGYQMIHNDEIRSKFEKEYGVTLNPTPGRDNHQMMDGIHEGQIHSLYLYGEDTGIVDSNINYVQSALEKVEFLVVQDEFLTFTATYADVVLPASPSLEKDGTYTNTERRIQRINQALSPLGDSKPDWVIFQLIAKRMGFDWNYSHPSEIMDEIARLTPSYSGVSYERLEGFNSLQWPVAPDGTDQPTLYLDGFNFDNKRAKLFELTFDNFFKEDEVYDLHVNNGRVLEHFHEGNMTYQTEMIKYKMPHAFVEISPELAKDRDIHEGAEVKLISDTGEATLVATITDRVKGKEIYIPLNNDAMSNGDIGAINKLTNSDVDYATHTPSYKRTHCRLEVITRKGKSPLNPTNFRVDKHRHPQYSVQVQKKWKRKDYIFPGNVVD
ncbi:MAG: molybdopterin-dependent oxidoreductase, partial [Staphylococcus sp.]|nr:molybdopterin-dependent oxidoreductase [Staphylococcus sp.]